MSNRKVIWIIEDSDPQRRSLERHLTRKGYKVESFDEGSRLDTYLSELSAANFVDQSNACLAIIMDINLPSIGSRAGLELVQRLREKALQVNARWPDVIFQTGFNVLPKDDFKIQYDPVHTLTKPFSFRELDDLLISIEEKVEVT